MSPAKKALARLCGRALRSSGLGARFFGRRSPIIFYHGVWPAGSPKLNQLGGITSERLHQDLASLAPHFEFVGLDALLRHNDGAARGGKPPLAVCFDDGLDMIRSGAIDGLDALSVPATMFVVTACVDNRHLMWMHKVDLIRALRGPEHLVEAYNQLMAETAAGPAVAEPGEITASAWCWPMPQKEALIDRLYRACEMPPAADYLAEQRPYMTWQELRLWQARGHAVGLHTGSHPFCDRLPADAIESEIAEPAALLRSELGVDSVPFAYPFGNRFPPEIERRAAEAAGLACMLGVAGLSRRGSERIRLERAEAEKGLDPHLFGEPLLELALHRFRPKPALSVAYLGAWPPVHEGGGARAAQA